MIPTSSVILPMLRQDVRLLKGVNDEDGSPRWMLYDPIANQYFTLSEDALKLIKHWRHGMTIDAFVEESTTQELDIDRSEISAFIEFLLHNNLVVRAEPVAVTQLNDQFHLRQQHWLKWLVHHYLFIRIPLLKPEPLLNWLFPKLGFMFSDLWSTTIILLGVVGIFLTIHQWDSFVATFLHFFSWQGFSLYIIRLAFVKIAHEFGHALVSKKHGCRVSSMGVAFLVMFPVLYTDTTDAWRLKSKYQRLDIVTAGIRVELYLALIATFLWSFLPDGILRSAVFIVATTSWITSLMVNLSPFLRFDGYYAFSDWLGVENLQSRSFALGRWYLRKQLFGFKDAMPEALSLRRQVVFIVYAWLTWLYRFFLFLGIAFLVYHFAFKLLGIVLFLIEIIWFIVLPIVKELQVWWKMRDKVHLNYRIMTTTMVVLGFGLLLVLPWQDSISLPAVLKDQQYQRIYPYESGRTSAVNISIGDHVMQGQLLVGIASDQLEQEILQTEMRIQINQDKLDRLVSLREDLNNRLVLEQSLSRELQHLSGLLARQAKLDIQSPITGTVVDMLPVHVGQYLDDRQALLALRAEYDYQLVAFVSAQSLQSIVIGKEGTFISNEGEKLSAKFKVVDINPTALNYLSYRELASDYGGDIATRKEKAPQQPRLIPEDAVYMITLLPTEPVSEHLMRKIGVVLIEGESMSYLVRLWRYALSVLIRESGF